MLPLIKQNQKNTGYSLVELLCVMFLSSIFIVFIGKIFLISKKQYTLQQDYAEVLDHARIASEILRYNIHRAGDVSCVSQGSTHITPTVVGYNKNRIPSNLKRILKSKSDVLLISSCRKYQNRIQYIQTAYYIDYTNRKNRFNAKIYGLYSKIIGGRREELLPDVNGLKLKLSKGRGFLSPESIRDSASIKSVKLDLSLDSSDGKLHEAWPVVARVRRMRSV